MDLEYTGWPLIELGHGKIEVAEGTHDDRPALIFGRNGTGKVGEATPPNRHATHEETLAVVTFANVESLDVVLAKLQTLREKLTANVANNRPGWAATEGRG